MGIKKINPSLFHGHRQEYDHATRGGVPGRGKAVPNMTAGLLKPETGETRAGIASSPLSATCEELQEEIQKLKISEKEFQKILEWLKNEVAKWRVLIEQSREGIVILAENGAVYEANQRFAEMLGYPMNEVRKLHVWDWDFRYSKEELREMLRTVDASGACFETQHRRKDGSVIDVELSNNASVFPDQKLILCVCRDITENKRAEERLRENEKKYRDLSVVDELTQLFNYRHFLSRLRAEVLRPNRAIPPSLLFIDLDDFKVFNDSFGHIEGDRVLKRIGEVITRCVRGTDYPFRYGGDEFAVLLPATSREETADIARRILDELKKERFSPVPGKFVSLTASIGVAQYAPPEDVQEFVSRADRCMYAAKKEGKNRICFDS